MSPSATIQQPQRVVQTPGEASTVVQFNSSDAALLRTGQQLGNVTSLREFGYTVSNALCNQLCCEQVGLGVVRSRQVEIVAISGCSQFKSSSPGVVEMRQAMEECLDHAAPVAYPEVASISTLPIHRQWSATTGNSETCSVPLLAGNDLVGIVSLRRTRGFNFELESISNLTETLQPFGTLLRLVERANRSLPQHTLQVFRERLQSRSARWRWAMITLLGVAAICLCFAKITYRPLCDTVVVPSQLRNMASPFEARLDQIHVQAGRCVQAGDVLVEFDTTSIRLQLESILAEIDRTRVTERAAIEAGDATTAALHRAQVHVLDARRVALEQRIRDACLVAPVDGMVIQSSCDKRLGQIFAQGDPVLQFAPHKGWTLDVHVPEAAAIYVVPGQSGTFASAARPGEKVRFEILQMDGSAKVIESKNVFVARAQLAASPEWMRSGMRGIAQVDAARKPVWWVAFHKLIDWTRLRFWL